MNYPADISIGIKISDVILTIYICVVYVTNAMNIVHCTMHNVQMLYFIIEIQNMSCRLWIIEYTIFQIYILV